jgi:hypothetical protein
LLAALTGLRLDELAQRRAQRLRLVAGASLAACLFAGGLAVYANVQRIEAERQRGVAEKESAAAKATADFLISGLHPKSIGPTAIIALSAILYRRSPSLRQKRFDSRGHRAVVGL